MNIFRISRYLSVFLVFSLLLACSSSGSDTTGASGSGRVSLLITDAPAPAFDQINITVESVILIAADEHDDDYDNYHDGKDDHADKFAKKSGDDDEYNESHDSDNDAAKTSTGNVVLFEGNRVINLLALRNFSSLLSSTTVPAGTYSKIRLLVSKVELVMLNPDGTVKSSDLAKLPANGKIDLNPRGEFTVSDNSHLIIELDIDAKKSIHIVATGKGYNFRPVIFVNILGEDDVKLVMLDGKVMEISDRGFRLCNDVSIATADDGCLEVLYSDETVVQNSIIKVVGRDSIENGDMVTVLGRASIIDIHALHIVVEDDSDISQNLALFSGKATSGVDMSGVFSMKTDDSNDLVLPGMALDVLIADGARVFDRFGEQVSENRIAAGSDIDLFGLAQPSLQKVRDVRSAFVIYNDSNIGDNDRKISGAIVSIDSKDEKLSVLGSTDSFSGDVCVIVANADMFLLTLVDENISSKDVDINGLATGMNVDVYTAGDDDDDYYASSTWRSCLPADVLLATEAGSVL